MDDEMQRRGSDGGSADLAPRLESIGELPLADRAAAYTALLETLQTDLEADGRG